MNPMHAISPITVFLLCKLFCLSVIYCDIHTLHPTAIINLLIYGTALPRPLASCMPTHPSTLTNSPLFDNQTAGRVWLQLTLPAAPCSHSLNPAFQYPAGLPTCGFNFIKFEFCAICYYSTKKGTESQDR